MAFFEILFGVIVAYLIGSIPTSIALSKFRYGIDIREHGSGSASHLNIHRIIGWKAAFSVRVFDIIKGFVATNLAWILCLRYDMYTPEEAPLLMICFGLAAVMGHIFSVWAGFRGGKGVHAAVGVLLALSPLATGLAVVAGFIVFLLSRYPNLGYVIGSLCLPFIFAIHPMYETEIRIPLIIFGVMMAGIISFSHIENIRDILKGSEIRARLFDFV
ncbi:MAG: glycerol-3-phosphate acyltransferase [Bacteroidia bacterium]